MSENLTVFFFFWRFSVKKSTLHHFDGLRFAQVQQHSKKRGATRQVKEVQGMNSAKKSRQTS